jgi:hypothetical protein
MGVIAMSMNRAAARQAAEEVVTVLFMKDKLWRG